jgi:hypothetical protein
VIDFMIFAAAVIAIGVGTSAIIRATKRETAEHRAAAEKYAADAATAESSLHDAMALVASLEEQLAREHEQVIVIPPETPEPLTPEQRAALLANKCIHCGGSHTIACPRVKRLRFRADGQTPVEIEFWALDEWRTPWAEDRIVWPEDMA